MKSAMSNIVTLSEDADVGTLVPDGNARAQLNTPQALDGLRRKSSGMSRAYSHRGSVSRVQQQEQLERVIKEQERKSALTWKQRTSLLIKHERMLVVWYLIREPLTIYYITYTLLSFAGCFWHPFCFAFHLTEVLLHVRLVRYVFNAVKNNIGQVSVTLALGMLLIYLFAMLGWSRWPGEYGNDVVQNFEQFSLLEWVGQHLDYGVRTAPVFRDQSSGVDDKLARLIFNMVYYFVVVLVFSSIIRGIIIDSFAQMRIHAKEVMHDTHHFCFICAVERDTLEHKGEGFRRHVKRSHNCWHYLFYKIHLSQKDVMEYTGPESYVAELLRTNDIAFFPIKRALCLEGVHADVKLADIMDRVEGVEDLLASFESSHSAKVAQLQQQQQHLQEQLDATLAPLESSRQRALQHVASGPVD
jgi:hypothetical protein